MQEWKFSMCSRSRFQGNENHGKIRKVKKKNNFKFSPKFLYTESLRLFNTQYDLKIWNGGGLLGPPSEPQSIMCISTRRFSTHGSDPPD